MESRQLRYFLAVAQHGSFSTAAMRIGVAQPALSSQVAKLEADLGCKLFVRHARGVTLTAAGQYLRSQAQQITDHMDQARRDTRRIGLSHTGDCTIGLPPRISELIAVKLIQAASVSLPTINVRILDAMGGTLREWLAEGRLNLAVVYSIPNEYLKNTTTLLSERFYIASARHTNIDFAGGIEIDALLRIPLVVSTGHNAHRLLLEDVARRRGVGLSIAAEIDSMSGQRQLVLMGAGAAVMPLDDFANWPVDELNLVPLIGDEMIASLLLVRGGDLRDSLVAETLGCHITNLVGEFSTNGS